ncbi:LysR family transcriptional regulator [Phenylobacterium sp. LjRoot219]|uniref:LysR family transcriptional regulator n=1 Tax=Phenylobacterium sp. LjRoot219 TaxID=3342283 RepID=UPI003ED0BE81
MIELRRLRYLVTLAMRLSYSRAAEELGISQSALTRAIQSLEKEMNLRLFDRDPAGVTLTEEGRRVVEKAEALLATAKDFELQVLRTSGRAEGRISFGITPIIATTLLTAVIPQRLRSAPDFVHDVMVRETEALWHQLVARDIEFFVSAEWQMPHVLPVRIEALGEFPISLIVRAGHPLLAGNVETAGFPLLAPTLGSTTVLSELRKIFGGDVHVFEDFASLSAITQATDAIWATSAYTVAAELAAGGLRQLAWPPGMPARTFSVMMYSLDRRAHSPAALELKQAFRQQIRKLQQGARDASYDNSLAADEPVQRKPS